MVFQYYQKSSSLQWEETLQTIFSAIYCMLTIWKQGQTGLYLVIKKRDPVRNLICFLKA